MLVFFLFVIVPIGTGIICAVRKTNRQIRYANYYRRRKYLK